MSAMWATVVMTGVILCALALAIARSLVAQEIGRGCRI
jgi:hypothetical protein